MDGRQWGGFRPAVSSRVRTATMSESWSTTLHFRSPPRQHARRIALKVPATLLPFVHSPTAPAEKPTTLEGLLHNGRAERLPPGEGEIRLVDILNAMPADIPVACEVPMEQLTREAGVEVVARRVSDGAKRVLAEITGWSVTVLNGYGA